MSHHRNLASGKTPPIWPQRTNLRERVPVLERRRDAGAVECIVERAPRRRKPGVGARQVRGVRRQRCELRQVRTEGVVDRESAFGPGEGDVDVQPAGQAAGCRPRKLVGDLAVALADRDITPVVVPGVRTRGGDAGFGHNTAREIEACGCDRDTQRLRVSNDRRHDLDLALAKLSREPRIALRAGEHGVDRGDELPADRIDEHQLLLGAQRERRIALEGEAEPLRRRPVAVLPARPAGRLEPLRDAIGRIGSSHRERVPGDAPGRNLRVFGGVPNGYDGAIARMPARHAG